MRNLQSVTYTAPRPSEDDNALLILSDRLPNIALQLMRGNDDWAQGIREVTLISMWKLLPIREWDLRHFQNLQRLHLLGLPGGVTAGQLNAIAEVILASPGLRSLGLCLSHDSYMSPHGLPTIILHYNSQRSARGLHVLRLDELHLGTGFVPAHGLEEWFGGNSDYLSLLTDLRGLQSLKVSNWFDGRALYICNGKAYYGVDPAAFKKAISLRQLRVRFFTTDIEELLINSKDTLVGLELAAPFHKYGRQRSLRPFLEKKSFTLQRVSLNSRVDMSWVGPGPAQRDTFLTHRQATELKLTIDEETFESFIETGLCGFPKLDRIFFINGRIPTTHGNRRGGTSLKITREFDAEFLLHAKNIFLLNRQATAKDGKVRFTTICRIQRSCLYVQFAATRDRWPPSSRDFPHR